LSVPPFRVGKGVRGIGRRRADEFFFWFPFPIFFWGRGQGVREFRSPYLNASNYQMPALTLREQRNPELMRDDYFMRCGIRVLRLSNESVRNDLATVIFAIRAALRRQNPNP
jgi:hypothetical protein